MSVTRTKCVRPAAFVSLSTSVAATVGRESAAKPASFRSTGRTKSSNVTMAETGFPGRPKTSVPRSPAKRPKTSG